MTMSEKYISAHVFYNTPDLRHLIVDCVDPVIARLTDRGLISKFFFIRYWENGQHLRLRLLPANRDCREEIQQEVEMAASRFFAARPSLFDAGQEATASMMRRLYEFEYGEEAFIKRYGADGQIPLFMNNSVLYIAYEPEYARYGGPGGIELAEDHFYVSSQIALATLRNTNSRVKHSLLGVAFQLMLHFVYAFYENRSRVSMFFHRYRAFYDRLDAGRAIADDEAARVYEGQAERLSGYVSRLEEMHERLKHSDSDLGTYVRHAYEIKARVDALYGMGEFRFEPPAASLLEVTARLLTSYVHMLNNRLGILSMEETYLASLIHSALENGYEEAS